MTRALAAAVLAAVVSVLAGPRFILLLRRLRYGQNIREDGPEHHKTKQGTPTMGGLLIVASSAIAYLLFTGFNTKSLAVLAALLGCAAIGFADDRGAVRTAWHRRRGRGMRRVRTRRRDPRTSRAARDVWRRSRLRRGVSAIR